MSGQKHHDGGPIALFHARSAMIEAQPESSHTDHVLTYVAAGALDLHHGAPLTVRAGTVALVPAGVPHRLLGGRGVEVWVATFCAGCLSLHEHQTLMAPFHQARLGALPVVPIPAARRGRLVHYLQDLATELNRNDVASQELARCLLLLILGEVQRGFDGHGVPAPGGSLVGDALAFIQGHCLEPISLRDVAAAVHRTPAHVATQVKSATGYTVGEWIAAGRVAEAAARLVHTDDRIAEIGEHVGWKDTTHFIRQFKKAYGAPPGAWRAAKRAGGPE